jgi:hypothetical protein
LRIREFEHCPAPVSWRLRVASRDVVFDSPLVVRGVVM